MNFINFSNLMDIMDNKNNLVFTRVNYVLMLIGLALLAVGFLTMSADNEVFGFGILGITIGPIIVLSGLVVEIFAIMYQPKK